MLCLAQFPRPVRAAIRLLWGVGIVGVALFAAGMLCWAAGYGHYFVVLEKLESPPYPSLSDALWLGYYVGAVVGLLALMTKGASARWTSSSA